MELSRRCFSMKCATLIALRGSSYGYHSRAFCLCSRLIWAKLQGDSKRDLECPSGVKPGLPLWGPHVRFRREQTLVREGSPSVKLRNELRLRLPPMTFPLGEAVELAARRGCRLAPAAPRCKARTRTDEGAILP